MKKFIPIIMAFLPSIAFAHPEHSVHTLSSGLLHPIFGVDHLVMLLCFGLYISKASISKHNRYLSILAALISMVAGLVLGQILGYSSSVEMVVIASLIVVASAIWNVYRASKVVTNIYVILCVSLFFAHGYAHGVEVVGSVSTFAMGMLISGAVLIFSGKAFGDYMFSRWISIGTACIGTALFLLN